LPETGLVGERGGTMYKIHCVPCAALGRRKFLDAKGKILYDKDYYFDIAALNKAWEGADYSRIEKYLNQS
jgi:hypothetical protein